MHARLLRLTVTACLVALLMGCAGPQGTPVNSEAPTDVTEDNSRRDGLTELGSYCDVAGLETGQVERLLGKPSKIENLGNLEGSFAWVYDDAGVTLYVTTKRPTNVQVVTTVFQSKGTIIDSVTIGDPEELVANLAGQVITTPKGDRIAQFTRSQCNFTITLLDGKIAKARIEPVGRED